MKYVLYVLYVLPVCVVMAEQICPAEFIGFIESQHPLHVEGEPICSHDELMANFFAQVWLRLMLKVDRVFLFRFSPEIPVAGTLSRNKLSSLTATLLRSGLVGTSFDGRAVRIRKIRSQESFLGS